MTSFIDMIHNRRTVVKHHVTFTVRCREQLGVNKKGKRVMGASSSIRDHFTINTVKTRNTMGLGKNPS